MAKLNVPPQLPDSQRDRFLAMAAEFDASGIDAELISDLLTQYLVAEMQYLRATNHLTEALTRCDTEDAAKWGAQQDRSFRQCRAAAAELDRRRQSGIRRELWTTWLR